MTHSFFPSETNSAEMINLSERHLLSSQVPTSDIHLCRHRDGVENSNFFKVQIESQARWPFEITHYRARPGPGQKGWQKRSRGEGTTE